MTSQENPVLKYDTIFKTLKTDVISDINNVLLDKFKPIIKEIENDISIFLLIEQNLSRNKLRFHLLLPF